MFWHVLQGSCDFGPDFDQFIVPVAFAMVTTNQPFEQFARVDFDRQILQNKPLVFTKTEKICQKSHLHFSQNNRGRQQHMDAMQPT